MEKRMLVAIVVSVAILIGYQFFFEKSLVPDSKEAPKREAAQQQPAQAPAPSLPAIDRTVTSGTEKQVTVENNLYKATFSSKGGSLKSIEIKTYKDASGKPIVLKGDAVIPPLALGANDGFELGVVDFVLKGRDAKLASPSDEATLVFEYSSGTYSVRRTYSFRYDNYAFTLKDEVQGLSPYLITPGKNFGIYEEDSSVHFGPVILKEPDRLEFDAKNLKEPKTYTEGVKWIAQEDKYFFAAIIPKTPPQETKVFSKNGDTLAALGMAAGANDYLVYAGPKEYDRLKQYGVGLEHIVDFGFFSILARPLFWVLKFFYGIVYNYGVAIIFLTVLVRIPFIPLVNRGQKSMKKLQDIQPRMAEIREKYKKDPQRMQQELMGLYKKHKVNPMGGCLPIVLQIPVFFALYKVLQIAIELRGAPFMFWIHDLSAKDPYYILPIVMGITTLIQQKMTPSTMDPRQQKIMMFMPVFFTFLFLSFPSGLVLYWLANNVLSIAQQFYVNKKVAAESA